MKATEAIGVLEIEAKHRRSQAEYYREKGAGLSPATVRECVYLAELQIYEAEAIELGIKALRTVTSLGYQVGHDGPEEVTK